MKDEKKNQKVGKWKCKIDKNKLKKQCFRNKGNHVKV